jgi:hypothetical protein
MVAALEASARVGNKAAAKQSVFKSFFDDAVPAGDLESSTELLDLLDGVEGPNLSMVLDTPVT